MTQTILTGLDFLIENSTIVTIWTVLAIWGVVIYNVTESKHSKKKKAILVALALFVTAVGTGSITAKANQPEIKETVSAPSHAEFYESACLPILMGEREDFKKEDPEKFKQYEEKICPNLERSLDKNRGGEGSFPRG